jgi:hypothetical protein
MVDEDRYGSPFIIVAIARLEHQSISVTPAGRSSSAMRKPRIATTRTRRSHHDAQHGLPKRCGIKQPSAHRGGRPIN